MNNDNYNGNYNDNYTWWNSTATATTSDDIIFSGTFNFAVTTTDSNWHTIKTPPDKNWMPYVYVEYEPVWHKKFASYKLQMKNMWD